MAPKTLKKATRTQILQHLLYNLSIEKIYEPYRKQMGEHATNVSSNKIWTQSKAQKQLSEPIKLLAIK